MVVWEPAMRESVSNQSMVDLLLALFSEHVAALDSGVPSTRDAMRFNIAGDTVRIMFQLTSEYGPLSDGTANAARAYPMTSEAAKVEAEVAAGRPAPAHLQALWLHSVEPLKRALLLDFHDPSRRQLQVGTVPRKAVPEWCLTRFSAAVVHDVRAQPAARTHLVV